MATKTEEETVVVEWGLVTGSPTTIKPRIFVRVASNGKSGLSSHFSDGSRPTPPSDLGKRLERVAREVRGLGLGAEVVDGKVVVDGLVYHNTIPNGQTLGVDASGRPYLTANSPIVGELAGRLLPPCSEWVELGEIRGAYYGSDGMSIGQPLLHTVTLSNGERVLLAIGGDMADLTIFPLP